jgi:hypothetical protein
LIPPALLPVLPRSIHTSLGRPPVGSVLRIAALLLRSTSRSASISASLLFLPNNSEISVRVRRRLTELKWESRTAKERQALTFEAFWERAAIDWAGALADRVGLGAECRARGLEGLLQVRAVRLAVGAGTSLVFSQVVEGREPQRTDGYDQLHAVMGSVANVFVTRDERLAGLLRRVPVDSFLVVTSLPELLADLGTG